MVGERQEVGVHVQMEGFAGAGLAVAMAARFNKILIYHPPKLAIM